MVLLALPLIIPACSSCSYVDTDGPDPAYDDPHKPLLISNSHQMESNAMMQKPKENQMQVKGRLETLGEEHSAKKLIRLLSHCTSSDSSPCSLPSTHPAPSSAVFSLHYLTSFTGVTCSHRVARCCIGPHANGLFPYVEPTRWKHPGSRNDTNCPKLRVHLCCSSVSDLRALWTK
uniref:Secreted protein n=1 Tax=Zea mays TaxID=4577 RepID=A0A804PHY6_MAIZE